MKPRIVILSAFLSPLRSGAEACAEEVPLALADSFDFTIVTARMRRDLPRADVLRGKIPVIRIGFGCSLDKWLYPFLAPLRVRKLRPDVVHAILETFAGLALAFCHGYRRLLTLQTTNRSFLKGFVLRSPDRLTCLSGALKEIARTLGREDVTIIPNGIDASAIAASRLRFPKVPGRILFVGRLESMKGVDTLLAAFAAVSDKREAGSSGARLHIVGGGSLRNTLERQVRELGIADRVTFRGRLKPEEAYREYAEAEVFCGFSRSEALGNVFLEAQAAGCVVIGTRVGGIPDIVTDGETGLLVTPDNAEEAADVLRKLLSDGDLRRRLSEEGAANTRSYDWAAIAKRYEAIYREMLTKA